MNNQNQDLIKIFNLAITEHQKENYEEAKKLRLYYERLYGGWPIAMVTIEKRQLHTKGE